MNWKKRKKTYRVYNLLIRASASNPCKNKKNKKKKQNKTKQKKKKKKRKRKKEKEKLSGV